MVHLSKKKINGHEYLYAVHSFRLPSGKVMKLSKIVKNGVEAASLGGFFEEKQANAVADYYKDNKAEFKLRDPGALEKIEHARQEYKAILRKLTVNQRKDLFDRFTVNFTYESNALEGNSLTLKQVAIVIRENSSITGKDLREIYETRNSREVVDLIFKNEFKVNEKDLLRMHAMLVKDMGIPEGYKKFPNYIHGRQVLTAPPEEVPAEMGKLFEWYRENKRKMHPLQLAAHLHCKFEEIHPFEDGNGRVGRFLILTVLANAGYPPLIIRKTQRLSYFSALEDFDNRRPGTMERFLYERLRETHEKFFKIYVKYL